jgi:hypothetical protein
MDDAYSESSNRPIVLQHAAFVTLTVLKCGLISLCERPIVALKATPGLAQALRPPVRQNSRASELR